MPPAKKMTFCFPLHIYISRRNFFVFIKITYLQPFREIMGGQSSVTIKQQTNEQTNKRTNTTNDHNSPSGFFQNPRANDEVPVTNLDKNFIGLALNVYGDQVFKIFWGPGGAKIKETSIFSTINLRKSKLRNKAQLFRRERILTPLPFT